MGDLKSVLFDLDGTLTDPKPGITRCIAYGLERLGLVSPPPEELLWCIGPPLIESLETLVGDSNLARQALTYYRERFSEVGLYENEVYAGIVEALAELVAMGFGLHLATSKPQPYAQRILDHFELSGYFQGVHGSSLDGSLVNKGELIAHLLATEALNPTEALMVGDRAHDVFGATANGIACLGVLYGYGSREELEAAGAVALCEKPEQLVGAIGRFTY